MEKVSLRRLQFTLTTVCAVFSLFTFASAQDKDWRPVTPAELSASKPVVETDADAEAIFWEVRVDDSSASELALKHYVRVKIFTERGREQFSRHDVVFTKGTKVKDVDARVTKPDGSTVFLKKEDVLEREILKASGIKVKAKSFALPGLEIGSIVEYRYREVLDNADANMRLIFQREVPIQTISYFVRPFAGTRGMFYEPFNTGQTRFEKDKDGYHRATMTNVQAFREEPVMGAEDESRAWMYIYYGMERKKPDEYWRDIARFTHDATKETMKANDEVKRLTAEAIAGATTDDDKLRKMFEYVRASIRNLNYSDKVTDEEWKRSYNAKSPADTLKLKYGTADAIDNLFGAMARAAGYDARKSFSGSRNELTFDRAVPNVRLMINSSNIAIKVGEEWRFFSPGSYFSTFGMLSWAEEGQIALITDPKDAVWAEMKLSEPEKSRAKRIGKFKLLNDGTLEGEASIEYTGHWGAYVKGVNRGDSAAEQENNLKSVIKTSILGTTEVENFTIENISDPEKPLVYKFKIRVPGYASRTGKRLFFQPNVFERSAKPQFTASTRKYDIQFNYPYSESDEITIEFPSGFALENADVPHPLADKQGIGSHKVAIGVTKEGNALVYRREFSFGHKGFIRFAAASYAPLKGLFEAFNKADMHQLTLREGATAATK